VPAGLDNPALGFATFAAVKLAGYSAFCHFRLARIFPERKPNPILAGVTRTLLGVGFGLAYAALMTLLSGLLHLEDATVLLALAGLVAVRLLEWWILLRLFYLPKTDPPNFKNELWYGVGVSFLLDFPSWIGLVVLGKTFIC
jgi:hypothetical protein